MAIPRRLTFTVEVETGSPIELSAQVTPPSIDFRTWGEDRGYPIPQFLAGWAHHHPSSQVVA